MVVLKVMVAKAAQVAKVKEERGKEIGNAIEGQTVEPANFVAKAKGITVLEAGWEMATEA